MKYLILLFVIQFAMIPDLMARKKKDEDPLDRKAISTSDLVSNAKRFRSRSTWVKIGYKGIEQGSAQLVKKTKIRMIYLSGTWKDSDLYFGFSKSNSKLRKVLKSWEDLKKPMDIEVKGKMKIKVLKKTKEVFYIFAVSSAYLPREVAIDQMINDWAPKKGIALGKEKQISTNVKIKNKLDYKVRFKLDMEISKAWQMVPEDAPKSVSEDLKTGSDVEVPVKFNFVGGSKDIFDMPKLRSSFYKLKGKKETILMEKTHTLPFDSKHYFTKMRKQEVEIKKVSDAPIIDAKLNDICWQGKPSDVPDFLRYPKGQGYAKFKTSMKLCHDGKHLYLAATLMDDQARDLVSKFTKPDSHVFKDDSLEVFLRPKLDSNQYYQIVVNPKGTLYDSVNSMNVQNKRTSSNLSWKSQVEVKTEVFGDSWIIEMKIPFKTVYRGEVASDTTWGINLARNRQSKEIDGKPELSSWTWLGDGGFHNLDLYGTAIFK